MKELFSLGELYVSDFISGNDEPRGKKTELKLMMTTDGNVRLEKSAPLDTMFGKYWYRSGINTSMRKELKSIVDSITDVKKLCAGDVWTDIACFVAGNFINTLEGNKNIKDISLDDDVLSHDGKYHKVIKLYERDFSGDFVSLKLQGLASNIKMTYNHPVSTQRGWVEAGNLELTDKINLRCGLVESTDKNINLYELAKKYHKYRVKDLGDGYFQSVSNGLKHQLPKNLKLDADLIKIFGYYIGEGSGGAGACLQFTLNISETNKAECISNYFKKICNINTESTINGKTLFVRVNCRILSSVFKGLFGHHAKNKKIPHQIINSKSLPIFLEALWFTDGHKTMHKIKNKTSRKNYIYSSVSKNLILDLRNILESLDIICSVQYVKNNRGFSVKDGWIYRLVVERVKSIKILENMFRGDIYKLETRERQVKILNIVRTKENNKVYNFEVDESNSYICNGITVHNCNDGTLLSFVPNHITKIGIDPVDDSFKVESEKHADIIVQDYFSAAAYKSTKFASTKSDVVTSIAMFYDLEDPVSFIRDVHEILDDNGVWVLQLSYTPLMIEQLAFDNILHEHIYYYSLFNLKKLFNDNGFQIVDCQLNDTNGGSFRVYAMKDVADVTTFGSQPHRDICKFRIESLLAYEKTLKLDHISTWLSFYDRINELKEKTVSFIKQAKANGKTIWVYGASTKGNTLLQYFGLDHTLIDGAAERSPYKFGLRTVGTNIPIYSEEEMRATKPDYLLVLPWHFINEFITREKDFLDGGSKFIVPCPKFQVIGSK